MFFFYIFRFDISDQMAAALANGFLTDFGVLRADSPAQQRIDPQEIAREKVRVSTKLEQERNTDIHSGNQSVNHLDAHSVNQSINQLDIQSVNQSISQLETCVERTVVEDHGTLIKLEQEPRRKNQAAAWQLGPQATGQLGPQATPSPHCLP